MNEETKWYKVPGVTGLSVRQAFGFYKPIPGNPVKVTLRLMSIYIKELTAY